MPLIANDDMCISPVSIKNPNYGADPRKGVNYLKDCTNAIIQVPCGHCYECIHARQQEKIQRFAMEYMVSDFFFCTLTYNNDMLPSVTVKDRVIHYPDYRDFRCFIKRLEKFDTFGEPFKYFAVSEYGSTKHRPHFHVIFALPKLIGHDSEVQNISRQNALYSKVLKEWRRNVSSTRSPDYKPLCTYAYNRRTNKSNFDFHYVNQHSTIFSGDALNNVSFYVSKYLLKYSEYEKKLLSWLHFNLSDAEELKRVRHLVTTRSYMSKSFGVCTTDKQIAHIRRGIDTAIQEGFKYPLFINPNTGATFPLCRYYKQKHFTYIDATTMHYNDCDNQQLDSHVDSFDTIYQANSERKIEIDKIKRFKKNIHYLNEKFNEKNEDFF